MNVFGNIAKKELLEISGHYSGVSVENFVVMPNHVHLIILLSNGNAKLDSVIGSYKSFVSKKIHEIDPNLKVWQVSFHDHIIRNQKGYENIWKYIESNPMNWEKDCFYSE